MKDDIDKLSGGATFDPEECLNAKEIVEELKEELKVLGGVIQSPAQKQQFFRTLSGACDFISGFQIYPASVNYVDGAFVVTYNNREV